MSKLTELDKAEREVKDLEQRLQKFKTAFKDVEEEIAKLTRLQAELEENIDFLKKSDAAVMAGEYKKAKEDLVRTRGRLSMIRIDRDSIAKAQVDAVAYLDKAKDMVVKALLGQNNVVSFKRKKDGG